MSCSNIALQIITPLTDKMIMQYYELPKLPKIDSTDNELELWLTLFSARTEEDLLWLQFINAETEEELEMLEQTGVAPIQEAVVIVHKMSEDEKIQEMARLREKALHDEATAMKVAREEGQAEGREEGRKEGRKETAKRLFQEGLPVELVARASLLTVEEVRELQKEVTIVSEDLPEYK